jgi:hypothetical protein
MKVFLDDVREAPEGWLLVRNVEQTLEILKSGEVSELSLDHDLGETETGYEVVTWIEEMVGLFGFMPPRVIKVHSANPVGRKRMEQGIASIRKLENGNS